MGTLLQELGHDQIILYFIHKVLRPLEKSKSEEERTQFFIVSPATGPKKDIYFWNPEKDEYTCAYSLCNAGKEDFPPEWETRQTLPPEIIEQANKSSQYKSVEWYKKLSEKCGTDINEFIDGLESKISQAFNDDLPDLVGVSLRGLTSGAEIKFEGFGKKALPQIENHYNGCLKLGIPYHLVIPEKPSYSRFNKAFVKKLLEGKPKIKLYTFAYTGPIPALEPIKFERFMKK